MAELYRGPRVILFEEEPNRGTLPVENRFIPLVQRAIAHIERHQRMSSHHWVRDRQVSRWTAHHPDGPMRFDTLWSRASIAGVEGDEDSNVGTQELEHGPFAGKKWILLFRWGLEKALSEGAQGVHRIAYSLIFGTALFAGPCSRDEVQELVRAFGVQPPPVPPGASELACMRYVEERTVPAPQWQGGRQVPTVASSNRRNRAGAVVEPVW